MKGLVKQLLERLLRRRGYRLALLADDVMPNPLSARGLRLRLFRQLERLGFRPAHVVDVGAHQADWSWDFRTVFPHCAFTLIEPQEELRPHLEKFCAAGNARYFLAGAAARDGELTFTIGRHLESSSFLTTEAEAREQGLATRRVPVLALDSVCPAPGYPLPEVVKIDAEGFELEVLAGATRLLGHTELFFLEVPVVDWQGHPTLSEILTFMADHGYTPYDLTDLNRHPEYDILTLLEIAFARRAGPLVSG